MHLRSGRELFSLQTEAVTINEIFRKLAGLISSFAGSAAAFLVATIIVLIWAATGPVFQFSTTWQLVINTATTIVTFLMVFLIQNTQNRDTRAIHAKLDELLVSTQGARNSLANAEDLSDEELDAYKTHFEELARVATASEPESGEPGADTQALASTQDGRDRNRD